MGTKMSFKPAIIDGVVAPNYFIRSDGEPFSTKRGEMRMLTTVPCKKRMYPKVSFRVGWRTLSISIHRVVCETWNEFPIPTGVTKSQWDRTPRVIKNMIREGFQVNHIDHNHKNYHPSNLEWVTPKQNAKCYREHVAKHRKAKGA